MGGISLFHIINSILRGGEGLSDLSCSSGDPRELAQGKPRPLSPSTEDGALLSRFTKFFNHPRYFSNRKGEFSCLTRCRFF